MLRTLADGNLLFQQTLPESLRTVACKQLLTHGHGAFCYPRLRAPTGQAVPLTRRRDVLSVDEDDNDDRDRWLQ